MSAEHSPLRLDRIRPNPDGPAVSIAPRLEHARTRLGLSQAEAARVLGTKQSNVSAYERGRLQPGRLVGRRIEAFVALPDDSIYRQTWPFTLASAAVQLRQDVKDERSTEDKARMLIQASDDFRKIEHSVDRALFLAEPSPTGDRRWDAALAGLAVHLCREGGIERVPVWTREPDRFLDEVWWLDPETVANRALYRKNAIPCMRARGVMFSRRTLESV